MKRDRVIMVRKLKSIEDDDGSFDLEFWERIGQAGRFLAACDMPSVLVHMGNLDADRLRLQRHVVRLVRGES